MADAHPTRQPEHSQGDPRPWAIYVLKCPDTLRVRYVGWTINLINRMAVHRYRAKKTPRKTYCEKWINSLLRQGKKPIMDVVERSSGPWQECERKWIKYFRDAGEPLTNLTDGGEGCIGYRQTEEAKEKVSKANTGRKCPEERKEYMRRVMTGRVFTDEWRAKISRTKLERRGTRGNKLTEEHKAKIAASLARFHRPPRSSAGGSTRA
jgi:hypothetical protein